MKMPPKLLGFLGSLCKIFPLHLCVSAVSSVLLLSPVISSADTGADVVVIYNTRMPESKEVAEYYANRRNVPTNQVWGFDLSTSEAITRTEYLDKIQSPILKKLEECKLWVWQTGTNEGRKLEI